MWCLTTLLFFVFVDIVVLWGNLSCAGPQGKQSGAVGSSCSLLPGDPVLDLVPDLGQGYQAGGIAFYTCFGLMRESSVQRKLTEARGRINKLHRERPFRIWNFLAVRRKCWPLSYLPLANKAICLHAKLYVCLVLNWLDILQISLFCVVSLVLPHICGKYVSKCFNLLCPTGYQSHFDRYQINHKVKNRQNGVPGLLLSNYFLLMFKIMHGVSDSHSSYHCMKINKCMTAS